MKHLSSTSGPADPVAGGQEHPRAAHRRRSNTMTSGGPARPAGELIGAIDQGTSSTRFLVFEQATGQLVASSQIEIKRLTPCEGWVEMDPDAIMSSVYATMANVHDQLEAATAAPLRCIGICNQRESAVVWDAKTGQPLYNVIVWMDNRTKDIVDKMIDSIPGRDFNQLKDKTGLPMSTYFSAFKLKWLIDNVSEVRAALDDNRLLFGTVDSWILWNLTGRHLTDVTNASRTFLMDIETLRWDKSLCKLFKVPMEILPKILSSADDFGQVQFGPFMGVPITGVIGDQSAALFGHNCLQRGQTKATFGTGCFIMQNIGAGPLNGAGLSGAQREAKRGLITTVGYKLRDRPACYALEGSIKIAGAALTWLRDNMQLIQNYEECDQLINLTTNAAGVFFVPALGGLYSPYWDPNAAGLFIGLSQFSRREHLVRATFDSVAFQTNDILSLMHGVTSGLMIDGGLCKSDNLCQILADITGCDINRPSMCETSALGAAMVAGFGAGIWSYESMLAQSNSPSDFSSAASQNHHHYPHESLHHDDHRFSALTSSKKTFKGQERPHQPQAHPQHQQLAQSQPQQTRRSFRHRNGGRLMRNLDAGGGINDDAGGGGGGDCGGGGGPVCVAGPQTRPAPTSNCGTDAEDEDEDELASSSGQLASCSEAGDSSAKFEHAPPVLSGLDALDAPQATAATAAEAEKRLDLSGLSLASSKCHSQTAMSGLMQLNQHHVNHVAPSSGYSSGDNFEAATSNSADSCQLLTDSIRCRLVDSPTSQVTDLLSSVSADEGNLSAHGRDSVATCTDLTLADRRANGSANQSPIDPDDPRQQVMAHYAAVSAAMESVAQQEQQDKFVAEAEGCADEVHEFGGRDSYGEDGYDSSTVSFDSYDDEQNGIDEEVARLNDLVIDDDSKNTSLEMRQDAAGLAATETAQQPADTSNDTTSSLNEKPVAAAVGHEHQPHKRRQASLIEKHMDVFQPYISLEHRTDLVNTWHLAVGRSMQWTKVHHEEVRKIDYQRLSSLPISMYVFFSIGMVALSGYLAPASSP